MTDQTISNIENEKYAPSIQTLRILANILQVSISYLGCFDMLPEKTLPQKIHKVRLYHGLTKKEFADNLGVNERTIREWENGKRKPSLNSLKVLRPLFDTLKQ